MRESNRAAVKRYREKHKELLQERRVERHVARPWKRILAGVKRRSRERGLEYSLGVDWGERTYTGYCSITGMGFSVGVGSRDRDLAPSVDRINPDGGYTEDNSRWVLVAFNSLKGRLSDNVVLDVARKIVSGLERNKT